MIGKLKADAADPDKDSIVTTKEGKAFYNPAKSAAILLDMGINRKTTKRQVMVLPYGGTKESCREYSEEWVKDKIRNGYPQLPEDVSIRGLSYYLSTHVWDAIGETVIAARDAMKYLQDMATCPSNGQHQPDSRLYRNIWIRKNGASKRRSGTVSSN